MQIIDSKVRAFLKLRAAPRHLNTEALREDMIGQIVEVIKARAPDHGIEAWIGDVIERAMIKQKGNAWPSVDVWAIAVGGATQKMRGEEPAKTEISDTERSYQIFCRRIQSGEPVGEMQVFGDFADRGLREGKFGLDQIRARQRAAFMTRKRIYGFEAAVNWMRWAHPVLADEIIAKHEKRQADTQDAARLPYAETETEGDQI